MDITYSNDGDFRIKTKNTTVSVKSSGAISFSESEKTITGAGEYEIKGVSVLGFQFDNRFCFVIEADKLRVGFVVGIEKDLPSDLIDDLGSVDILITDSVSAVTKIEPYFVILFRKEDSEKVSKETGYQLETMPKFSVKKDEIVEDQNTKIILLEAK